MCIRDSLYTIQNPQRGSSFFTVWRLNENLDPVKTIKLDNWPISASCLSEDGLYMGIGTSEGSAKIITLRTWEIECSKRIHEMIVKGVTFVDNGRFLISGSTDYTYDILPNVRASGWFSLISKIWILGMTLMYLLMFIREKLFSQVCLQSIFHPSFV
eukprot:TRINITY_DN9234_c0_g3_i5.p2 TRINITY_DN9234_c0_g3~~TRINITY_DN9234_c0_g3_i5.p2  ORF type:complete len:157 (+),score=14.65 TRINITY_DN9234_c0_g3_i5:111-581(+)